jgi:hypothetical protein
MLWSPAINNPTSRSYSAQHVRASSTSTVDDSQICPCCYWYKYHVYLLVILYACLLRRVNYIVHEYIIRVTPNCRISVPPVLSSGSIIISLPPAVFLPPPMTTHSILLIVISLNSLETTNVYCRNVTLPPVHVIIHPGRCCDY